MLKKAHMIHMLFIFVCGLLLSPHSVADRGIITYYHNDLLGSPQFASDQYGDIKWKEDYKPYGEKLVKSVAAKDNRVGYTGASHDNDTGLTYLGARYYDPNIGRFMAIDPVGFNINNTASVNRYAYANNNPYRYVDPNGESPIDVIFLGADLVKLGVALHSGNPLAIQSSMLDVGASLVGVVSPIPGTGQLIKTGIVGKKVLNAAEAVQQAAKVIKKKSPGQLGREGEATATAITGVGKNTQKFTVNGVKRIPDQVNASNVLTKKPLHVTEVKNVKAQSYTKQLKDDVDLVGGVGGGGRVDVMVRSGSGTKISKPLQQAHDNPLNPINIRPEI